VISWVLRARIGEISADLAGFLIWSSALVAVHNWLF